MPGASGTLPSISLPKGGGAIRVFTAPGRHGSGPQIALSYDSGAGNGPYRIGWSIGVQAITRKTTMGLRSTGQPAQLPPLDFGFGALTVDDTPRPAYPESVQNLPGDVDGANRRWIDLDRESLQGILDEDEGAGYYKHSLSGLNPRAELAAARRATVSAERVPRTPEAGGGSMRIDQPPIVNPARRTRICTW